VLYWTHGQHANEQGDKMYTAKYTTLRTAQKYGVNIEGLAEGMADYGMTINPTPKYVEIIEAGYVVDYARYILIRNAEGEQVADFLFSEMQSVFTIDGRLITDDDIEVRGFPPK
jgi:hypothetical protein